MNIKPIYVVAGNYQQFQIWCVENQVSNRSPLVKYVSSPKVLLSCINPTVIYIGTVQDRPDLVEIMEIVERYSCYPKFKKESWICKVMKLFHKKVK